MADNLITMGMDASSFLNTTNAVDARLQKLSTSLAFFTTSGRSFNDATGEMTRKLGGLTTAGDTFQATLKQMGDQVRLTSINLNGIKQVTSTLKQELGVDAAVLGQTITDKLRKELDLDEVFATEGRLVDREFNKLVRKIEANLESLRLTSSQARKGLFRKDGITPRGGQTKQRIVDPALSGEALTQTGTGRDKNLEAVIIATREFADNLRKAKTAQDAVTAAAKETATAEKNAASLRALSVQRATAMRIKLGQQATAVQQVAAEEAKLALALKQRSQVPLIPQSDKARAAIRDATSAVAKFSSESVKNFEAVEAASAKSTTKLRRSTIPLNEAEKKVLALRLAVEKSQEEVIAGTRKAVNAIVQANTAKAEADAKAIKSGKALTNQLDERSRKRIQAADTERQLAAAKEKAEQAEAARQKARINARTQKDLTALQTEVVATRTAINQRVRFREILELQLTRSTDAQVRARIANEIALNTDKINRLRAIEAGRFKSLDTLGGNTPEFQQKRQAVGASEKIKRDKAAAAQSIEVAKQESAQQVRITQETEAKKKALIKDRVAESKKLAMRMTADLKEQQDRDVAAFQKAQKDKVAADKKANADRIKTNKAANAKVLADIKEFNNRKVLLRKQADAREREKLASSVAARFTQRPGQGFTKEQAEQSRRLRDQLLELARTIDIPKRRFKQLVDGVVGGFRELGNNPAEKAVRANLNKIVDGFQAISAAAKKAAVDQKRAARAVSEGRVAAGGLTDAAKLPRNVSPADAARVQSAIIEVQNQTEKLGLSGRRVVSIFNQMQKGIRPAMSDAERNIVKSLRRVMTSMDSARKNVKGFTSGFLLSWQSMGRLVAIQQLHRGVALVSNALREGTRAALEFGQTIARIQTIIAKNDQNTRAWGDAITDLSNRFGVGLQDVAEGVFDAVSNQIVETTQDVRIFGETVAKLARVTGSSFEATGNLIAGLLNSFQLGLGSLEKVASQLFRAVDLGKFTIEEIAEQIGRAAPTANLLGIEMNELLGFLASLTIQGRKANTSLTLIRNIMAKLLKPTEAMTALMNRMGFETGNAAIEALGAEEFFARLAKFGVGELVKAFSDLRAVEGIIALVADEKNFEKLTKNIKQIGEAAEQFKTEATKFFEDPFVSLQTEATKVKNFFQNEFGRGIVTTLSDLNTQMGGFTELISEITDQISNTPIVSILSTASSAVASLTGAATDARGGFNALFTVAEVGLNLLIARMALLTAATIKQRIVQSEWMGFFRDFKRFGANSIQAATAATAQFSTGMLAAGAAIAIVTIAIEGMSAIARDAERRADRFAERVSKGLQIQVVEVVKEVTDKFDELTEKLKKSSAQILEFFAVIQRASKVAQGELDTASTGLQSLIKERFKQALKSTEDGVRDLRNKLKKITSDIKDSQDEIVKISEEATKDRFKALQDFAEIDDKLAAGAVAAERKRLDKSIKEFDKIIESSEKRIKTLLKDEAEQQFDFDQPFGDAERQFDSLLRKAEEFQRRAAIALTLGDQKEAADLFGQSEEGIEAAQKRLKEQIKEQKDIVKKAIAEQEKLAKKSIEDRRKIATDGATGVSVRDRINERAKLQEQAQAAIAREGELTRTLVRIEQQRRDVVKDQIDAERELQQVKRQEKEDALAALADLKRAELARQTEVGKLREGEISRLEQLSLKARAAGQFDVGATALESQKTLLEQARAQQLAGLGAARQAKDLEAAEKFNRQILETDRRLFDIVAQRTTLEERRQQSLDVQGGFVEQQLQLEQDRLLQAQGIAREVNNIKINADASLAELDIIEARMVLLGKRFTEVVGDRFKDELGRSLDVSGILGGGFDVLRGVREGLVEIPADVAADLAAANIEAESLDDAAAKVRNKLRQMNALLKETADLASKSKEQHFLASGELENQTTLLSRQLDLGGAQLVAGGLFASGASIGDSLTGNADRVTQTLQLLSAALREDITGLDDIQGKLKRGFSDVKKELIDLADQGVAPTDGRVKVLLNRFQELSDAAINVDEMAFGSNTQRLTDILSDFGSELRGTIASRSALANLESKQTRLETELELLDDLAPALRAARDIQADRLEEQRKLNRNIVEEIRLRALAQGAADFDARKKGATGKRRSDASSTKTTNIDLKFDINGVQDPRELTDMIMTRIKRETRLATNSL